MRAKKKKHVGPTFTSWRTRQKQSREIMVRKRTGQQASIVTSIARFK